MLAGLKPEIILDICMRAVAFYEYQTSQEIAFRAMIQKNIQERYKVLKDQFDIATRDLNRIIKGMGMGNQYQYYTWSSLFTTSLIGSGKRKDYRHVGSLSLYLMNIQTFADANLQL